jgi:peptidoglycan/xylan/chitin deacetylase (PgdA/CDA1 family)
MTLEWPNGARCVALITVDFDGTANEVGKGLDPAGVNSLGAYSARRGIPRFLEIFDRQQIPATFFIGGYDAEENPETVKSVIAAGHEVAAHGYLHESWDISEQEEDRLLRRTHDILTEIAGTAPLGWRSPGGQKSSVTLPVLRELGCIYDSSDKDYDHPYPASINGDPTDEMVELPNNTSSLDDAPLYMNGALSADEMLQQWKAEFDEIYNGFGYYVITCHPRSGRGSGLPARARTLDRLISYIQSHPDVHFARMADLARWCLDPAHGFLGTTPAIGGRR